MKNYSLAVIIKGVNFAFHKDALNNKTQCLAYLFKKTKCVALVFGIDTSRAKKYIPTRVRRCLYIPLAVSPISFPIAKTCLKLVTKIYNSIWIYFFIWSYRNKNKTTKVFILYDDFQISILFLKLLTLGFPCIFVCCVDEWGPASASNSLLYLKQKFVSFLLLWFGDGSLSISSYITDKIFKHKPTALCLHLPAISYIPSHLPSGPASSNGSFVITYAANIAYQDQLNMVLRGFLLFKCSYKAPACNRKIILNLILSGDDLLVKQLQTQLISEKLCKDIVINNNLDDANFASMLYNSDVLLCPLSKTINNIARFPQKLAEYSAACGLIIVSPVGDVRLYFTDMVDSIFLTNFDPHSIFESLQTAFLLEPANLASMKSNARIVFDKHFSIDANAVRLKDFLAKFN